MRAQAGAARAAPNKVKGSSGEGGAGAWGPEGHTRGCLKPPAGAGGGGGFTKFTEASGQKLPKCHFVFGSQRAGVLGP